jgi:hypothetical protein
MNGEPRTMSRCICLSVPSRVSRAPIWGLLMLKSLAMRRRRSLVGSRDGAAA